MLDHDLTLKWLKAMPQQQMGNQILKEYLTSEISKKFVVNPAD
jgi:hypothetical protein